MTQALAALRSQMKISADDIPDTEEVVIEVLAAVCGIVAMATASATLQALTSNKRFLLRNAARVTPYGIGFGVRSTAHRFLDKAWKYYQQLP